VNEQEMSTLLARAADAVPVDVESLVAGGVARGRAARRRRRAGAGVAGALGVAAVVGAAVVLVPHGGSSVVVEPAGQPGVAGSTASASAGSSRSALTKPIPSSVLDEPHATYPAAPDAALTLHNEAIHAALAQLLPAGTMGPILTDEQYPARDQGNHRAQFFLYDGALVTFIIDPAKGSETCESFAAAADPAAGYSSCRTVGDTQVMTESQPRAGLNAAMVWHHGYEITVISYDNAPATTRNPALDGKKLKTVSDTPPLDVPTLVAVASSDAWFE
jgi:hypothetical protein